MDDSCFLKNEDIQTPRYPDNWWLYPIQMCNIYGLEVRGPSGPQLLVGGPSGRLDFVLRALRALRPRLTHQTRLTHQARQILFRTNQRTNKAILGVGYTVIYYFKI